MIETPLISEIRAQTGITTAQVSDADFSLLIGVALDEYATYRPNLTLTSSSTCITTVAEQPNYAYPEGTLWIVEVFWQPDTDAWNDLTLRSYDSFISDFDPSHPADLVVHYHELAALRRYLRGDWKIVNGEIWLVPSPYSSGDKVAVLYATAKSLSDLANVKDHLFRRLVTGYLYERRAMDLIGASGWRAGAYSVNQQVGQQMNMKAVRELTEVRALLAQTAAGMTDYTSAPALGVTDH